MTDDSTVGSGDSRPLTDRAFGGLLWQFVGKGTKGFLQIGFLAVLARLITPEEFGIVAAAMIVIGLSMILSQLGVGPAIIQHPNLTREHVRTGFTISVGISVLIASVVWLSAPLVAGFFRMPELEEVLLVLSAVFILRGIGVVAESLLQRELSFRALSLIDVGSYAVGYGMIGTVFGLLGYGYWALVAGHVGQTLLQTVLVLHVRPHPIAPKIGLEASRHLLFYGGGFTIGRGFNYAANQGDNLVVGRWLGAEALGIYGRAYQFLVTPATLFGQVISSVLFPSLAEIQDDRARMTRVYRRAVSAVGILALPAGAVMLIAAEEIVLVLLGSQWEEVILPLRIMAAGILCRTSYKLSDSLAKATGAVYRRAWRQAMYAALVLIGGLVGQLWGVPGVATGVLVAIVIHFLLMAHLSLTLTSLTWLEFARAHKPGLYLAFPVGVISMLLVELGRLTVGIPLVNLILVGLGALFVVRIMPHYWPEVFLSEDGMWVISLIERNIPSSISRLIFSKRMMLR